MKRRDYKSNARKHYTKRSGCMWCGAAGYGGPTQTDYCSDVCVQMDHEGIDDLPPVVPLAWPDSAYASRKWARQNDHLNNKE